MGCGISTVHATTDEDRQSTSPTAIIGEKIRKTIRGSNEPARLVAANTQWKEFGSASTIRAKSKSSIVEGEEAELRQLLEDPVGQKWIGRYAKQILTAESFFCWVEISEFLNAPSVNFKKSMAKHIYQKYVRDGSTMALGGLTSQQVHDYQEAINSCNNDINVLNDCFISPLQRMCFQDLYSTTFLRFKASPDYKEYKSELKDTYNKVTEKDFEYLELLGSGGFGRVVHARKKSTGKHYAMKIQLKTGLLYEHSDDLSQITLEKDIFQRCNHPYIVDMHYSFQTPAHAIIVLELIRGGDLNEALKHSKEGRLEEQDVMLYAAEIALALNHLHDLGLIYRDLKPCNVLLGEDGHVKLADMGLATGFNELPTAEEILTDLNSPAPHSNNTALPNIVSITEDESPDSNAEENDSCAIANGQVVPIALVRAPTAKRVRRKTTVGTKGYMAPELIRGKLKRREEREGYNNSVDYWSLGVTIYELICGFQPFQELRLGYGDGFFGEVFAGMEMERAARNPKKQAQHELERMSFKPEFPDHVSDDAKDFCINLLNMDEKERLGCRDKGFLEIIEHPFLSQINWDKILVKHMDSSYKPVLKPLNDKKKFNSYEHMMSCFSLKEGDSEHNWSTAPNEEEQTCFEKWDYISPHTLKAELGISIEMEQSNLPFKVQKLTGEKGK